MMQRYIYCGRWLGVWFIIWVFAGGLDSYEHCIVEGGSHLFNIPCYMPHASVQRQLYEAYSSNSTTEDRSKTSNQRITLMALQT
jgi:hypothetical protein